MQIQVLKSRIVAVRRCSTAALACICLFVAAHCVAGAQTGSYVDKTSASLRLDTESTAPRRFLAVHGRRALIAGYSNQGLEVWAYPFQIVKSFGVDFRPTGTTTETKGLSILRRITYAPESITRTYIGPDYVVREKLFVPLDLPAAILSYDVESPRPIELVIHFVPVLDLMWPASIGGQETTWHSDLSGYVISEPTHRFSAIITSPDMIAHDGTANIAQGSTNQNDLSFTLRAGGGTQTQRAVNVVISGGTATVATEALNSATRLEREARNHYASLLERTIKIETPDPSVNRALAWSQIALDQAWVCDDGLGCGLVAGYGPSRHARRPQYDWFFAGDGLVATQALLSTGDFPHAREELQFILKFQDAKTGMIWHELSQSAPYLDWVGKYPYMYVHVDVSFQFLSTVASYIATTGDQAFLESYWPSLKHAYEYCLSVLNSSDGLPRIPGGKEGGNEQQQLTDELRLSAAWVAAAEGYAQMAALSGHGADAGAALAAGRKARAAIAQRYWSTKDNFWISGYTRAGVPFLDKGISSIGAIQQNLFTQSELDSVLTQMASSDYQTDWGTRSVPLGSTEYHPNSYASGSVWPIGTAEAASVFWTQHRPVTAFSIWSTLPQWASLDSLGHMHEAAAGDFFHEQLESVPEQSWSSTAFLTATISGLLGLGVEPSGLISFSPHLPSAWERISIKNIHLRRFHFDANVVQTESSVLLDLHNAGGPFQMLFAPEVPLGTRILSARLGNKPIKVLDDTNPGDAHARVELEVPAGDTRLAIQFTGGVSVFLAPPHVLVGSPSGGIKIVEARLSGQTYTVTVDFRPGSPSSIYFRTPWKVQDVQGATFQAVRPGIYELEFNTAGTLEVSPEYRRATATVRFAAP